MSDTAPELEIRPGLRLPLAEIQVQAIRAQGAGGQHVNKVSSAIHLRFDIRASSLPEEFKQRLLTLADRRISGEGVVVIKAQRFRSQEKNRDDALQRLCLLLQGAAHTPRQRRATRPSKSARNKRMDTKTKRGQVKSLRGRVERET